MRSRRVVFNWKRVGSCRSTAQTFYPYPRKKSWVVRQRSNGESCFYPEPSILGFESEDKNPRSVAYRLTNRGRSRPEYFSWNSSITPTSGHNRNGQNLQRPKCGDDTEVS